MQLFVITFNFIANKEEIGLTKTLILTFYVIKQDTTGPRVSIFSPDLALSTSTIFWLMSACNILNKFKGRLDIYGLHYS